MTNKKTRIDESLDTSALQKSLTGQSQTSINLNKIKVNSTGNIVRQTNTTTNQQSSQNTSNSQNKKKTATTLN